MKNLAIVSKEPEGYKVVLERVLPHPIAAVWDAVTNPEKIRIWFMEFNIDFKVGGKMTMIFSDEERTVTHGEVTRIEKPTLFEYLWEGELLKWELTALGENECKLTLTHSRISENYMPSVPAGWHVLLRHIEEVLNGRTTPFPSGQDETEEITQLKAQYSEIIKNLV